MLRVLSEFVRTGGLCTHRSAPEGPDKTLRGVYRYLIIIWPICRKMGTDRVSQRSMDDVVDIQGPRIPASQDLTFRSQTMARTNLRTARLRWRKKRASKRRKRGNKKEKKKRKYTPRQYVEDDLRDYASDEDDIGDASDFDHADKNFLANRDTMTLISLKPPRRFSFGSIILIMQQC